MQSLKENLYNSSFSHIYIEEEAINHPNTRRVLENFKGAQIVYIKHYKDVFSRAHQNFTIQKNSPKLILAIKKDNLIYRGASVCEDFGNLHFYYTSTMMNCLYDCEYCYLQGMYPSANIVVFVNIEDIFTEIEELLKEHPLYLCISYDTDILAFENVLDYARSWIDFASEHRDLTIELRTKSANFKSIEHIKPIENIILAWTVSPDEVINKYEHRTPSLDARLSGIKAAIEGGWKVRLCFDPILYINNWQEKYNKFINTTFAKIPGDRVYDVSIGVFRVSKDYLKKMRKQRGNSVILNYPYETINGVDSYPEELSQSMTHYIYELTGKYVPKGKIYL